MWSLASECRRLSHLMWSDFPMSSAATGPLMWLGLTACEEDPTWNALVGFDQHLGLDGEPGIA